MCMTARAQTMGADKLRAQTQPQFLRRCGSQHHLQRSIPNSALLQVGLVEGEVRRRSTHNAKALKVVAQANGHHAGHHRVRLQRLDGLQRHVTGRHIQVKNAGQNELHRAAFGAHHHINPRQIALERLTQLVADQE